MSVLEVKVTMVTVAVQTSNVRVPGHFGLKAGLEMPGVRCSSSSRMPMIGTQHLPGWLGEEPAKRLTEIFMSDHSMSHDQAESLARELMVANETGQMVPVVPSARPGFDLDTAYEVEATLKQLREAAGHRSVGRKVGYANKAMWRVLKLETLVWAHMYEDTVHYSDGSSASLTLAHFRSLKVEPEIVFGLKQPVAGEGSDAAAALASADWLAPGFEIIDCPFPDWKFQPSDFVASLGLHAALVVGERTQVRPDLIGGLVSALAQFKVRVSKNGEFVEEGSGKNSLKSPALCLAELGAAIARRFPNEPLSAGEIDSSGTLTAGHPTGRGDVWRVEVEGLSLPPLTLTLL